MKLKKTTLWIIGLLCVASPISYGSERIRVSDSDLYPTDPCEVVLCPSPEEPDEPRGPGFDSLGNRMILNTQKLGRSITGTKNIVRPLNKEDTSETAKSSENINPQALFSNENFRKKLDNIALQAQSNIQVTSASEKLIVKNQEEMNRIRACHEAYKNYAGFDNGKTLDDNYWPEYKDKCFRSGKDLKENNNELFKQITATLVGITVNKRPLCMGSLLNKHLVLTARHCFLAEESPLANPTGPLNYQNIGNASIEGIGQGGKLWKTNVQKVQFDPFDKNSIGYSSVQDFLEDRKLKLPNSLDFLVLQIQPKPGLPESLVDVGIKDQIHDIQRQQRLMVGAFFWENGETHAPNLYVDDSLSCMVREYEISSGYLHHHCQTIGGISGSPVFLFESPNVYRIIGIHVSSAGEMDPKRKPKSGNEASVLPLEMFKKALKI